MKSDIEELLKTTIQAKVIEAFNAAPDVIEIWRWRKASILIRLESMWRTAKIARQAPPDRSYRPVRPSPIS